MSKATFNDNLAVLGLPDRAALEAMFGLTPEAMPHKEEILEVMESISSEKLVDFLDAEPPTELSLAFRSLRTA